MRSFIEPPKRSAKAIIEPPKRSAEAIIDTPKRSAKAIIDTPKHFAKAALLCGLFLFAACQRTRPASTGDCSRARTGEFECLSQTGMRMHITRTAERQIEVSSDSSSIVYGHIRWTGPCTYLLFDQHYARSSPPVPQPRPEDTAQVTIVAMDAEGYDYDIMLNHNTLIMDRGRMLFAQPAGSATPTVSR